MKTSQLSIPTLKKKTKLIWGAGIATRVKIASLVTRAPLATGVKNVHCVHRANRVNRATIVTIAVIVNRATHVTLAILQKIVKIKKQINNN